jgi:hypothetical protein
MSEHEALLRFHDWCAAWHGKAETRRPGALPLRNAPTTFTSE